jgi:ABC-type amino acid transport substrate-binding protein
MWLKSRIIATFLLALVVAGCNQPAPIPISTAMPPESTSTATLAEPVLTQPPLEDSWQKVQQAGVLRVGTSADYPPFEYYDENHEFVGYDIALIQQISQKLGLKVEINDFAFEGLPMAVANDQVDVVISALSVTPERQEIANFSNVYYASTDAVLSRPEADPKNIQNPEALAAARLGVQLDSIYETYAQEKLINAGLMPKQNLFVYIDIAQAVDALKAKQIDAVWLDLIPAQQFADGANIKILAQDLNQQLYAIGMKKGADSLLGKINETLTQLQNDGTLANLAVQYLGVEPANVIPPPTLTPTPPQPTQAPPKCLDGADLVKDLSYDDQQMTNPPVLSPGQPFTKGWRLRNIGTCTWKNGSYKLVFSYGNVPAAQMGGQPVPVTKDVKPNETFDFQVNLIAPIVPGEYEGYWNMRNAQNTKFGETIWVNIIVAGAVTPTPPPTQTPAPNINFTANPTTISEGQTVIFQWSTDNAKAVYFYHDGQNWSEHPVPEDGQAAEYPPNTMNYHLHVIQQDGSEIDRPILITVNPAPDEAPVIEYLTPTPSQIMLGESVSIDWKVSGPVHQAILYIDDVAVLDPAPVQGNYMDTPEATGTRVYKLIATGPGGEDTKQVSVNVQTPEPEEPTPTPEPIEPVPTPPVIQGFDVTPTTIGPGGCVTASWTTGGGTTRVQLLRNDQVIWEDTQLNNSVPDCPPDQAPAAIKYTLVAYNNAGQTDTREATVQVAEASTQILLAVTSRPLFAWQWREISLHWN